MKKLATLLVATAFLALAASSAMAANQIRISQVYGGGGAASTTTVAYQNDYVEIFNSGGGAVNVGGWTIEYASAAGAFGSSTSNIFTFPANTMIQPCSYLLVASTSSATGNGPSLTGDFSMSLNMGGVSGKVALFSAVNANVACSTSMANIVDYVGYGSTASCFEGASYAGNLSTTTAALRNNGGMTDTDNNNLDFTVTTPNPRKASSPQNTACLATPTLVRTWGSLKTIYR